MIARIEKLLVKISKSNNEHQLLIDVDTMKLNPSDMNESGCLLKRFFRVENLHNLVLFMMTHLSINQIYITKIH